MKASETPPRTTNNPLGDRISAFTVGVLLAILSTSMIPFAYEKGIIRTQ